MVGWMSIKAEIGNNQFGSVHSRVDGMSMADVMFAGYR